MVLSRIVSLAPIYFTIGRGLYSASMVRMRSSVRFRLGAPKRNRPRIFPRSISFCYLYLNSNLSPHPLIYGALPAEHVAEKRGMQGRRVLRSGVCSLQMSIGNAMSDIAARRYTEYIRWLKKQVVQGKRTSRSGAYYYM